MGTKWEFANFGRICEIPVIISGKGKGGKGGGKLSTSCFVYEAAHMRNLHSFFISIVFFFGHSVHFYYFLI